MKKILQLGLAFIAVLAIAGGCKGAEPEPTLQATPIASPSADGAAETPSPNPVVVAESSNIVSDKEKQEILNKLIEQIDGSFNSVDEMDELDESDLNMDDIE